MWRYYTLSPEVARKISPFLRCIAGKIDASGTRVKRRGKERKEGQGSTKGGRRNPPFI
jgi:hypothetical protein